MNYKGKTALVTGASSGIGKAFAKELAARGCHVVLAALSQGELDTQAAELASTYGVRAHAIAGDLSLPGAARALAGQLKEQGLPIDILINNAGFGTYGRFDNISADKEQQLVTLNIASLVELTHQFLPDMVNKQEGIIVNVSSLASFLPTAYMAVYCASKAFILSFSEALWAENRRRGVRIVALCPGPTQTEFFNDMGTLNASGRTVMASPEQVARTGLRGIEQGRSYIVDGYKNYLSALMVRLLPRKTVAATIEKMTRPSS